MRGNLIQKFLLVIKRTDDLMSSVVEDGGFDNEFGELKRVEDGSQFGLTSRREKSAIRITAQISPTNQKNGIGSFSVLRNGFNPETVVEFTVSLLELERKNFVSSNGNILISAGDRIVGVEDLNGNPVITFCENPGVFIDSIVLSGFGLACKKVPKINLVKIVCSSKLQGSNNA